MFHQPDGDGYQKQQLFTVGEQVGLSALPQLQFCLQEPVPQYFVTRTAKGQRTYATTALPLQLAVGSVAS